MTETSRYRSTDHLVSRGLANLLTSIPIGHRFYIPTTGTPERQQVFHQKQQSTIANVKSEATEEQTVIEVEYVDPEQEAASSYQFYAKFQPHPQESIFGRHGAQGQKRF